MKHHRLDWLDEARCRTGTDKADPLFFPEDIGGRGVPNAAQRLATVRAKARCNGVTAVIRTGPGGEPVVTAGPGACPVREQCLAMALEAEGAAPVKERAGIFGGLTPRERYAAYAAAADKPAPKSVGGQRRPECIHPGTAKGYARHVKFGERPCGPCSAHELDEAMEDHVRRLVEAGYTNREILGRTTATAHHIRLIRAEMRVPDPATKNSHLRWEISAQERRGGPDMAKIERRLAGERRMKLTRVERHAMIRMLHAQGLSDADIERRSDVHRDQVCRDRATMGLEANAPGRNLDEVERTRREEAVRAAHAEGLDDARIAGRVGVGYMVARSIRRRLGLPANYGPGGRRIHHGGEAA